MTQQPPLPMAKRSLLEFDGAGSEHQLMLALLFHSIEQGIWFIDNELAGEGVAEARTTARYGERGYGVQLSSLLPTTLKTSAVAQLAVEEFLKDEGLRACRDLCNKGKHLYLAQRPDPAARITVGGAGFGRSPFGTMPFGGSAPTWWVMQALGKEFEVTTLADRVQRTWQQLFLQRGL